MRVIGGGVISTDGKERPFIAVEVTPGKVRAFYMSTGTGGQTDKGEWVPFAGVAGDKRSGWFIKAQGDKRAGGKYKHVSEFLKARYGDEVERASGLVRTEGGATYNLTGRVGEALEGEVFLLNNYLAELGAISRVPDNTRWADDYRAQVDFGDTFTPAQRVWDRPEADEKRGERGVAEAVDYRRRGCWPGAGDYSPRRGARDAFHRIFELLVELGLPDDYAHYAARDLVEDLEGFAGS